MFLSPPELSPMAGQQALGTSQENGTGRASTRTYHTTPALPGESRSLALSMVRESPEGAPCESARKHVPRDSPPLRQRTVVNGGDY